MQDEFNDLNLNEMNFLPYFEIRFLKAINSTKYDIYDDSYSLNSEDAVGWDVFIPIDY